MNMTPSQRLERAHVSLIRDKEYMWLAGIIPMGKNEVVDDPKLTARTNGLDAEYGMQFISTLTDAELMGLVLHEKLHCAFKHLRTWKHLHDEDHKLANMACDFVINIPINDRYLQDGFVKLPDGGCIDDRFRDMDAAEVFAILKQEASPSGGGKGTGGKGEGFDEHDWEGAAELTEEEADELSKTIDQALRQGNIYASKAGANVDRNILEMLKPKVDWRTALREFVTNTKPGDDYTSYRRPDRRFMSQNLMMPTPYSDHVYRVAIGVDTSGSIGDKILSEFLAEVQGVCESVTPELVDLMYWGHNVAAHETYTSDSLSTLQQSTRPRGGGGTEPSCVTRYMRDERIVPDCIVMLTDGEVFGDWGEDWPAPVLWCINDKHITAPSGVTVHI
jgi:predicted metal-dependent peptidase